MMTALIALIALVVGVLAGVYARGRWPGSEKVLTSRPRDQDPEALLNHLRMMDGCTCAGDGIPCLASYYCTSHGPAMREKFPTVEALKVEIERLGVTPKDVEVGDTLHVTGAVDEIAEALEAETHDSGRLDLLRLMCPDDLDRDAVYAILDTFIHDSGRVEALKLIKRKVRETERMKAALAMSDIFIHDSTRDQGRRVLLGGS